MLVKNVVARYLASENKKVGGSFVDLPVVKENGDLRSSKQKPKIFKKTIEALSSAFQKEGFSVENIGECGIAKKVKGVNEILPVLVLTLITEESVDGLDKKLKDIIKKCKVERLIASEIPENMVDTNYFQVSLSVGDGVLFPFNFVYSL